ncbi:MAG: hypothetical protein PUJ69_07390 [Porphyromonas somerae]|uniref:hypothetical protein n=1 Tax=Porphyromonas somerae TaxID=322095 RepID=UPI0026E99401|nr:hypothetical protein [Porphyromonas somerae]MDD7558475.1 hypothetical protein [Porphyromonas somerae]MDY3120353.1 hypothetical protein [Porphyromonas somerae]MDY3885571.1 hypothetical protein [Porphyromonas somerae]MDY5815872.1 hypothetical protein [Porphyromonas somerae]
MNNKTFFKTFAKSKGFITLVGLLLLGGYTSCAKPKEVPDPIFSPRSIKIDLPDAPDLTQEESDIVNDILSEYKKNGK